MQIDIPPGVGAQRRRYWIRIIPGPRPGAITVLKPCDLHLQESLALAERMITLSFIGDAERDDNGCGVIYGVMRDTGFRLKEMVTREIATHQRKSVGKVGHGPSSPNP
jgi:hypothetical protein